MSSGVGFDGQGKETGGTLAGREQQHTEPGDRQRQSRDLWAAGAGLVAVGAAVVLGELTASLVSPTVSPVTAVGGAVIDTVPPGVKEWAISLFGTADKVALV